MNMKQIFLNLTIVLCLLLPSCSDWLDIDPVLEVRQNAIFESEQGFRDVLNGVYIRMASSSLYGRNTTMVLPELMAQHWTTASSSGSDMPGYISDFDFTQTETKSLLETTWLQYYQCIVNLNAMLAAIDEKEGLFSKGNYQLIKGEALGLRGFLHFEVLRYWGAAPSQIVMSEKAIPYVTIETKDPNKLIRLTYQEVLNKILTDLDEAEQLLVNDPILLYPHTLLNTPTADNTLVIGDESHYYRYIKFNLLAVKATKARYHMWIGEKATAAQYARQVINATQSTTGAPVVELGTEVQYAIDKLLTFPREMIFAASNSQATQTLTSLFFQWNTMYTQNATRLATAFESSVHTSDIRYKNNRLFETKTVGTDAYHYFKKYNLTESTATDDVPLIRLAEMYFIVTESGDLSLFRNYRVARGLDGSIDGSLTNEAGNPDETAIMERLEKEYRKDFYGEGQMFFFYKRLGYDTFLWPTSKEVTFDNYRLPIPETQAVFE